MSEPKNTYPVKLNIRKIAKGEPEIVVPDWAIRMTELEEENADLITQLQASEAKLKKIAEYEREQDELRRLSPPPRWEDLADGILREENRELKAQTSDLIDALINMVYRDCQIKATGGRRWVDHMSSRTYEDAIVLLEKLGHARRINMSTWELIWPK